MTIKFEGPAIMVADMQAARAFYEGLLGQEVLADFGANVPFKSGFSLWEADHALGVIYKDGRRPPAPLGRDNVEFYFESTDLDAAWARVSAGRADVIHPIEEAPWGQRCFRVHDPDGHIVEVGEPLPTLIKRLHSQGLTAEAISARTSVPIPMVEAMLQ
ncbi:VOC family protein [Pseudodesulfovibrio sp.]|uniref:VOC family protein n=1 Tax=Pseudodesulfovibrio sp. TaxID=2035812 RepID=UPI002624A94C|nr:VOC family protein [Pseudodesulfovibrio sp.]MDD3311239.1 VOC family protein [Pseudodesulfovibrio sp.]